jgi:hypothetical protein
MIWYVIFLNAFSFLDTVNGLELELLWGILFSNKFKKFWYYLHDNNTTKAFVIVIVYVDELFSYRNILILFNNWNILDKLSISKHSVTINTINLNLL